MMEKIVVYVEKCGYFTVHIQGTKPKRAPVLLTVPDLGCNHTYFASFVEQFMHGRFCWCHVELPGQSYAADDWRADAVSDKQDQAGVTASGEAGSKANRRFSISSSGHSYPTMQELAMGILTVFEKLDLTQVVLISEGSGANLLSRVAILDDSRVLGIVLIHGRCTQSGPLQRLREKMKSWSDTRLDANTEKYLLEHRFGATTNNCMALELKTEFTQYRLALMEKINSRNLNQLIYAYAHRTSLADTVNSLEGPMLLISGSRSGHRNGLRQMYEIINKARKTNLRSRANVEFIEILDCVSPVIEAPEKVAESILYFLQGIGLVTTKGTTIGSPRKVSGNLSAAPKSTALPSLSPSLSPRLSPDHHLEEQADISSHESRATISARSFNRQMSMAELDLPRGPNAFTSANWSLQQPGPAETLPPAREHGYQTAMETMHHA